MSVDQRALHAYRLLQSGQAAQAVEALQALLPEVVDRPALASRLHAWATQALLIEQDAKGARKHLSKALRIARAQGDAAALEALAPLQQAVFAAMTAAARPAPTPETPAARAVAAYDAGDAQEGERLARAARAAAVQSGDTKEEVVALLALARSPDCTAAAIHEAAQVADQSGDRNLVTAVAKAAAAAGVDLGVRVF